MRMHIKFDFNNDSQNYLYFVLQAVMIKLLVPVVAHQSILISNPLVIGYLSKVLTVHDNDCCHSFEI